MQDARPQREIGHQHTQGHGSDRRTSRGLGPGTLSGHAGPWTRGGGGGTHLHHGPDATLGIVLARHKREGRVSAVRHRGREASLHDAGRGKKAICKNLNKGDDATGWKTSIPACKTFARSQCQPPALHLLDLLQLVVLQLEEVQEVCDCLQDRRRQTLAQHPVYGTWGVRKASRGMISAAGREGEHVQIRCGEDRLGETYAAMGR